MDLKKIMHKIKKINLLFLFLIVNYFFETMKSFNNYESKTESDKISKLLENRIIINF